MESFLGDQGQAHAHGQEDLCLCLGVCSRTYGNLLRRFPRAVLSLGDSPETLSPVTVGVGVGRREASDGEQVPRPQCFACPCVSRSFSRPVRSARLWGWGPRRMLPRIPPGPSPCGQGFGDLCQDPKAASHFRCPPAAGAGPPARPRGRRAARYANTRRAGTVSPPGLKRGAGRGAAQQPRSPGAGRARPPARPQPRPRGPAPVTGEKKPGSMSEFWLISAPGDKENLQALERMNTVTSKSNLSYNTKFMIPDFKVGTLDSLVGLSDELGKLDAFAESLIRRMAQSVVEVMEDAKGMAQENLLANGVDLTSFVTHFEWDMAKYPAKQPLVSVVDTVAKQLAQIETDLKSRMASYNTLKTNLENLERKSMGNLFTRTLSDIVSKEDFVLDSEYLITLLVIVPKQSYTQWQKTYESLSDMVVPRSTKLIAEDNEGGLFTVTLFRKVIDDFKTKAKENKFTVREYYYDEKEIKREREEMSRLLSDKKQQYGPLLRWLKVNFSETFIAWIHIKALRVFVESVLRYGLPVNFQAVLLQPKKSSAKRLREVLNSVFRHLDQVAAASILDASVEIPGLQLNNQDYFPYVYFHLDLSLLD
uniref:V-type proton ATPase subunit C n=1 Tax=Equus caballus TaxID=9796 RepID=A0A3Q2H1N7_HORSE